MKIGMEFHEVKWTWFFLWLLTVSLVVLGISCTDNKNSISSISKENLPVKFEEAFSNIMRADDTGLSDELLKFLEEEGVTLKSPKQLGLKKYFQAHNLLLVNRYDEAEIDFFKALGFFESIGDSIKSGACFNEIGILYLYRGNTERSLEYSLKASKKVSVEDFPEIAIDINYNLMNLYKFMGQSERMKTHADRGVEWIKNFKVKWGNLKFTYDALAKFEYGKGNYEKAKDYLALALKAPCENECFVARKVLYERYADIYRLQGNYELASVYYEKAISNQEKHAAEKRNHFIGQVKNEINLKEEVNQKTKELLHNGRALVLSVLFFLILTIAYAFFVVKQHRRIKNALGEISALNVKLQNTLISKDIVNHNLEAKKNEVQGLLELNERALFSKELKLSTIKGNIAKIASEVSFLAESDTDLKPNLLLGFEKKLLTVVTDQGLWDDFKVQFEQIRPAFFSKLKSEYPNLSVNDLKHCSYIVSNLKNKDVAGLINVSARSVETTRYRLKKKMNLGKGENLYDFLQKI